MASSGGAGLGIRPATGNQTRIKIPNAGPKGNPPATGSAAGGTVRSSNPPSPNKPVTSKPATSKPAPKPFDPTTSSFGLNLKDNSPFNPLGGPTTQGQFNQEVLNAAQQQYLPQLQGLQGQTSAEDVANQQRTGDIGSIYNQYQQSAQDAFKQVWQSLAGMMTRNSTGDQNAQANLNAALASSQGGENSLAQMMGLSGVGAGQNMPYAAAAQNAAQATQDQMSGLAQGSLGLEGENLANVGNERATELNTESIRHQGALQGIQSQQQALEQQIPGIIQSVRDQMMQNLQNAEGLRFQQNLAAKQFGLSANQQQFSQGLQAGQFKETQLNDQANRATQAATIKQNATALANQQAATAQAAQTALAKAQGTAQANAIKYLTSWLAPDKQELETKKVTNPDGSTQNQQVLANPNAWHRDVGSALRTLMTVYGLPLEQALSIMEAVGASTYVSGQGGMTIAEWAYTFRQRQAEKKNLQSNPAAVAKGLLGGMKF